MVGGGFGGRHVRVVLVRWSWVHVVGVVVVMLGLGVVLFPQASNWFRARAHATTIAGWAQAVERMPASVREDVLQEAREFNEMLHRIAMDPYGMPMFPLSEEIYVQYRETLRPRPRAEGFGPASLAFGRIQIPAINVDLPIFHGADGQHLAMGVGHTFGTDLPVGGAGKHAVLAAHSGLPTERLFTDLFDLRYDDVFVVTVLDYELWYRVVESRTVLPVNSEYLARQRGRDLITLVTCTPIGVNSHRYLVVGERTDPPPHMVDAQGRTLGDITPGPGFPWWAIIWTGGTIVVILIARQDAKTTSKRLAHKHHKTTRKTPTSTSQPQPATDASWVWCMVEP